jgi:2,3-dihydro-2,3-dihydroxybenzoate dehydrogenase
VLEYPGIAGTVGLVTGAAQGIGEATARRLARHGARVAIVDSNYSLAEAVAADICASGGQALAFSGDVRDVTSIDRALQRVEHEVGAVRILVNAAGVLATGPVMTFDAEDWEKTLSVNTTGVFLVSQAVARVMVPRRAGAIVTIGSNAAGVARINMAAYAASKAAAAVFTKCLGLELAAHGIRCNVVSPGSTDTPMQRSFWTAGHGLREVITGSLESFRVGIPLGKIATAHEIASTVLFLVSDYASHITMQDVRVDGGATLGA